MKISISAALSFLFLTFCTILFINFFNFFMKMQEVNTYHYMMVHEIENSDFSPYVIERWERDDRYDTQIVERSVKDDLRIYEVKTSAKLQLPILGYETEYIKESVAR